MSRQSSSANLANYCKLKHHYNQQRSYAKQHEPVWVAECKQLLSDLIRNGDSEPFLAPVDQHKYPDYLKKVQTPMDLGTIKERLLSGHYNAPNDLNKDLKLIFQNAKAYMNRRTSAYSMALRLQALASEKMKPILNRHEQEEATKSKSKEKTGDELGASSQVGFHSVSSYRSF